MGERGRGNGKNLAMDGGKFTIYKFKEKREIEVI